MRSRISSPFTSNFLAVGTLSIKQLTLLGFTLVALPLVLALIYSAIQINQLSQQGTNAIYDVAQQIKTNRTLSETLIKMERSASQYVVLKDQELLNNYIVLEHQVPNILAGYLTPTGDKYLRQLSQTFAETTLQTSQLILQSNVVELSLEQLQKQFKKLATINQNINLRSNELINFQASHIRASAEQVWQTILKSLIIIPVIILIAGLFIFLITKPLKLLTKKIQILEQGHFEHKIEIRGSVEIREIAEALEMMRTRLHALELQKSSFIRHISHELKTPLAAIREGTELLHDNCVGQLNEQQREISNIIRMSVNRLQMLIEDLLNFNIILDSTSLQDGEKLDFSALVDNVLADRVLDIRRKNLIINKQLSGIFIHCNAKQLQVILDNLLSNAIKYSPDNGTITIASVLQDQQLILTISDQGRGIDSKLTKKVFDAFYQGPAPHNHQIKGSGLGLTIVKELLMRLNGTISIEPQADALKGTTINIKLPKAYLDGDGK